MRYGGFEMPFFRYAGFEFQKAGEKSGMQDWATPRETPPDRYDYDMGHLYPCICMSLR